MCLDIILKFVLISLSVTQGNALSCTTCTWSKSSNYYKNSGCFDLTELQNVRNTTCSKDLINPYCSTKITINDGSVTNVERGCSSGTDDVDRSTTFMPSTPKCIASFSIAANTESVICYHSCNETDNCNNHAPKNLKSCRGGCSQGMCDYNTGTCHCTMHFTGDTCSTRKSSISVTPAPVKFSSLRSCVQCNGVSNPACINFTEGSLCTDNIQTYCAVSKTISYNTDGTIRRESVTKSCTARNFARNECFVTDSRKTLGFDYTCVTTCDTDNCNVEIPVGEPPQDVKRRNPLSCVVCSGINEFFCGMSARTKTICPSSATHCHSTVSYLITDMSYLPPNVTKDPPNYLLLNISRSCGYSALTRGCSTENFANGLSKVTCQESCQTDGCNFGWPTRPRCSQCTRYGHQELSYCKENLPLPSVCSAPYHQFCYIIDTYRTLEDNKDYIIRYQRGCSHLAIDNKCTVTETEGIMATNCTQSCNTNDCNIGSINKNSFNKASSILPSSYVLVVGLIFVIGNMLAK